MVFCTYITDMILISRAWPMSIKYNRRMYIKIFIF